MQFDWTQGLPKGPIQRHSGQLPMGLRGLFRSQGRLQPGFNLAGDWRFAKNQQHAVGKWISHGSTLAQRPKRHG